MTAAVTQPPPYLSTSLLYFCLSLFLSLYKVIQGDTNRKTIHPEKQRVGLLGSWNSGMNKGSVVVVNEMDQTADNKYSPSIKNSTLNSGNHRTTGSERGQVSNKKNPFLTRS